MLRLPLPALALILALAAPAPAALAADRDPSGALSGLVPPGSSTASATATPSARVVDINIQPSRLFSGQQTTVSGQVVSADDQQRPLGRYAVQAVDDRLTTLDQTVTDADGRFDLVIAPSRSTEIELQVGPDAAGGPVTQEAAPPIRLYVAPRLPHTFPNRYKLTSVLAVAGSIAPGAPNTRLVLEQRVGRSFRTLAATQADERSRYRFTRDFPPGTYVLRVRFLGAPDLAPAAFVFRYSVQTATSG